MGIVRSTVASVCALAMVAGPVLAQPTKPSDSQRKEAGELVRQAIAKAQAGDHDAAIELYLKAYSIAPNNVLLSNVGAEYKHLDKPVLALKYFCWYLKEDPTGTSAGYARAQAKVLEIELGNHDVDESSVCKPVEPRTKPLPPPLPPPPAPPAPEPALTLDTPAPPRVSSHSPGRGLRIAGISTIVLGAAASGVGGWYAYKGYELSGQHSNPDLARWPDDIVAQERLGDRYNALAEGFFAGAGALVITGAILYWRGAAASESVSVAPTAGAGTTGISLAGKF